MEGMSMRLRSESGEREIRAAAFLEAASSPLPSDGLRVSGLQRIYARAESAAKGGKPVMGWRAFRSPALLRHAVLAILTILLVMVFSTTGVYALSLKAQPDSPLYGAKIFFERARLALTTSSAADLRLELDYSDRRMEELREMYESGNGGGVDRWLREYRRNIAGCRSLIDGLPASQADGLYLRYQEVLDRQARMMQGMMQGAPAAISGQIEEASSFCDMERRRVKDRHGMEGGTGSPPMEAPGGDGGDPNAEGDGPHGNGPEPSQTTEAPAAGGEMRGHDEDEGHTSTGEKQQDAEDTGDGGQRSPAHESGGHHCI